MNAIKLTARQEEIIRLVKENQPITSEKIASNLSVTRAALRPDLAILTMTGILEARPKVGYIYSKKPSYSIIHDYLKEIKIKEIMSASVLVQEECSVYDGIVQLFLNDVGTLFIENDVEGLVGAVSRKDFLKIAMGGSDIHKVPIGIIMTRMPNIIYISEEDSVYDAAKKIIVHEVDSLPVVRTVEKDNKTFNKVIGKVSKTNITKFLINLSDNG
ncbi:helix-turn-helix transcriptional regulator [Hathewaya limosa]|uniref:CBS domain-containing protein n=1 Tax=Hathewaya limosa TaxID=1536 RepID=A0ABU0JPB7_HATLI|nr:helix-turn-helix transcriptional regulator [Hathewaya limosa]MDQ0478925.1 CBS domain-containing protein [Hathewaya limosa]